MHEETNEKLGMAIPTLPLGRSHAIVCANALTTDWNEVLPAAQCSCVMGNPPYAGAVTTSAEQKQWLREVYPPRYSLGRVDFCSAWFVKAADYMAGNEHIRAAFVATNSICQGQQVATLWGLLLGRGIHLHFAWPSFAWRTEAAGGATVTVIIVGFGRQPPAHGARLYRLQGGQVAVQEGPALTPYLTLGKSAGVIVRSHSRALSAPLPIALGNMPIDGGNLILEYDEGETWLSRNPEIKPFLKRYVGGAELMGSYYRYCLWLKDEDREQWERIPEIMRRVEACRDSREQSVREATRKGAETPWRFQFISARGEALVVPNLASERRLYMPTAFVDERYVVAAPSFMIPDADECHFAVLSSRMHQCWIRLTAGRLESRYRYSVDLVYNTFIWPEIDEAQHKELWELGNAVLMRRERYYQQELGKLYNDLPADLWKLHQAIDEYVERLYRPETFGDDEERTAWLLDLYAQAVAEEDKGKGKR